MWLERNAPNQCRRMHRGLRPFWRRRDRKSAALDAILCWSVWTLQHRTPCDRMALPGVYFARLTPKRAGRGN
jgi:hypothetical protein